MTELRAWFWKSCECSDSGVVEGLYDIATGRAFCVPERCPSCGVAFHIETEVVPANAPPR